jgi:hypothetical protein
MGSSGNSDYSVREMSVDFREWFAGGLYATDDLVTALASSPHLLEMVEATVIISLQALRPKLLTVGATGVLLDIPGITLRVAAENGLLGEAASKTGNQWLLNLNHPDFARYLRDRPKPGRGRKKQPKSSSDAAIEE